MTATDDTLYPAAWMRVFRLLRLGVAAAIAAAVVATFVDTASRTPVNPFNFFGYFTLQSNLIGCVVLVLAAAAGARAGAGDGVGSDPARRGREGQRGLRGQQGRGGRRGSAVVLLRGAATTYLVVVGLVYAVLLAPLGAAGGVPVPWANVVLHVIVPVYFVVDWLIAPDRQRLPCQRACCISGASL